MSAGLGRHLVYSWDRAQPATLDRSWQSIRHTTCFRARRCLLGVTIRCDTVYLRYIYVRSKADVWTSFWHQFFISCSPIPSPITSSYFDSPLCTSITFSLFHSRLKTYLFHTFYPLPLFHFFLPDCLHGSLPGPFLLSYSVFIFFLIFFVSGPCARLSWPSRQILSSR